MFRLFLCIVLSFIPHIGLTQNVKVSGKIDVADSLFLFNDITLVNENIVYKAIINTDTTGFSYHFNAVIANKYDLVFRDISHCEQVKADVLLFKDTFININYKYDSCPAKYIDYTYKELKLPISTIHDSTLGEIAGKITDGFGYPVTKAVIRILQNSNIREIVKTDMDGNYSILLPEGVYNVEISKRSPVPVRLHKSQNHSLSYNVKYKYPFYTIKSIPISNGQKIILDYILPLRIHPLPKRCNSDGVY